MNDIWSTLVFLLVALLFIAAALAFILPPLLRRTQRSDATERDALNIAVYRDQLRELEGDLENGLIEPSQYEPARLEIEKRLAEDLPADAVRPAPARGGRWAAYATAATLPVAAIILYAVLGAPVALMPGSATQSGTDQAMTEHDMSAALAALEQRMQQTPDDVNGWLLLARSYSSVDRHADASKAYAKAAELMPEAAYIWSNWAEAMALSRGGELMGEPMQMVEKAIALDPNDIKGLELAGIAAYDQQQFALAVELWGRLLTQVPADSEYAQAMTEALNDARQLAAAHAGGETATLPVPTASSGARVSGMVTVSAELADRVAAEDVVYVFARAVEGPAMPVAIRKVRGADLPYRFVLDDSTALMGGTSLSNFDQVIVGARVSKTGDAMPRSGDLEGMSAAVKVGSEDIEITIDRLRP
ncbi:MAG: c-type cytochrome biogenesis protein CcmI [Ectothiorhodospiraceae bacterium]|jgi:cytochrome c-type biogenesis protein CcmH|nr:c-type cytochrome biogenesis protein CcmI [Ectothiorhodospiraceae bacterium]